MCGIAGYIDFNARPSASVLDAMTRALSHRGPDGFGTLIEGACGLAHTRLSIIDVAGSPQPMAPTNSRISLVYNGELYNYRQLRETLQQAGEQFVTSGDTEVILRSLAGRGIDALSSFDGMFALGAWDKDAQRLLLARDALGEKPLFYATPAPGVLVFGSEAKALLELPGVAASVDLDALRQTVRFQAVYGERCLHAGIQQLEPGCYLEFSREGHKIGRFYDLIQEATKTRHTLSGRRSEDLIATGRNLFMASVDERLIADVPVGAFLSGGLDSSLIVAAMRKLRGPSAEIRTFSVGFEGDAHSELPFAQMVADALGTRHQPLTVGPESYVRRMAELSALRDAPVSQPADVAIAEMSKLAATSVKVALSGEGADEVFAGYPKYSMANAPEFLGQLISGFGIERSARLAGRLGLSGARATTALRALAQPDEVGRIVQWFSYLDRKDLQSLLPGLKWSDSQWTTTMADQAHALDRAQAGSPLFRMQAIDCLSWLPSNMLERGDRMTMAEGLEMRPPFLDKELVAFGLALPDKLKIQGRVGKWIVRRWADELLPAEIVGRKKWGFRVPLDTWFRGPLRTMLSDYVSSTRGLCGMYGDGAAISSLVDRHQSGEIDASTALWTLLSTEVWYQDVYLPRLTAQTGASLVEADRSASVGC